MRNAFTLVLLILCVSAAAHAVPSTLSYQGILTDPTGQPVNDGAYSVTFSLFNSASGGSALWTETQTVSTLNGLLTTTLGQVSAIPDTAVADTAAYLQIAVASDPPLSPRTRLSSAPYSMVSSSVRGGGPVHLEALDVSSGGTSTYDISVSPPGTGTAGQARKSCSVIMFDAEGAATESLDLASGYVTTVHLHDADDTLSLFEIAHLPGSPTTQTGMAVAIPAFMKNARKAKTAESAESTESLDPDSGYAHTVLLVSTTDTTTRSLVVSPPTPSSGVAIPKFLDYMKHSKSGATAEKRETLDGDTGYAHTLLLESATGTTERSLHISPPTPSGGVAIPKFLDYMKHSKGGATAAKRETLDVDSGYVEVSTMQGADFSSSVSHGTSQTREHVLLGRQVGIPTGGTKGRELSLATEEDSAVALLRCVSETDDTSDVALAVTETEQSITLSTTTAATKWPNIVLKRGLTASEMTISHVSAGPSSVIHASVDGAVGAQFGINTATPTLAFQLVGSGCYSGTFGACSDRRFKDQITTLSDPLTTLRQLRGVNFTWKHAEYAEHAFPEGEQLGLIAQEVEAVVPSVVSTGTDGYKSVDYAKLVPLLIEAVKDQQRQIDQLKAQLEGATLSAAPEPEMGR